MKSWCLLFFLSPLALCAGPSPNLLVILADDMGFSDLGCYGSEIRTPHLDALAFNGLRFTQMYNTSKCMTSRACLLTGCYAQQVGMMRPAAIVNAVTLGEVLRPAGYRTLWSGKHHGTENPLTRGFDRYIGLRDGGCNYFNPGDRRPGEAQPAQKRKNRYWCFDQETVSRYTPKDRRFYTTDAFTDYALDFLEAYKAEETPFLLYVAYNAPHDPLHAWPEDIAKYQGAYDTGYASIRESRIQKQRRLGLFPDGLEVSPPDFPAWNSLSPEKRADQARRMEVYAAMVDRLDQNVGRLIAKLKAIGKFENTLILFASDNGGSAENVQIGKGNIGDIDRWSSLQGQWANVTNTPFRNYKNYSHEGGICTPFIAHWPKGITATPGTINRSPLHFIDFMATFIELAGAEYPAAFAGKPVTPNQGVSFVPAFVGKPITRSTPIFFEWSQGRAVRDGKWKAIRQGHKNNWALYDLDADRTELHNLAERHPERLSAMVKSWTTWYATTPPR